MVQSINLSPVKELLTSITTPESLAKKLDDLAYNYAQMFMELQRAQSSLSPKPFFDPDAAVYLWWLQQLRDILRACQAR